MSFSLWSLGHLPVFLVGYCGFQVCQQISIKNFTAEDKGQLATQSNKVMHETPNFKSLLYFLHKSEALFVHKKADLSKAI